MRTAIASRVASRLAGGHGSQKLAVAPKLIDPNSLTAFVDILPIPRIAKPVGERVIQGGSAARLPVYRIPVAPVATQIHRDVPLTRVWGYGGSMPGPTIEARSGDGIFVEWPNELPTRHFLPIDHHLMGAEADKPEVRTVVHLHGAKVPPESDGYPEDWYVPGRSATYHYPNEQDPALLWYHDHAMGINRLNIYAGLAGLYVIRAGREDSLNLPAGAFEIPLVLMDRMIRQDGQLYYPVSQIPDAPWIAELFGNAILVNGKLLPYVDVQPRKYRFRVLNASNARFFSLALKNGPAMHQIGSDQGLLAGPIELKLLTLAPAERADLIIDFADHKGERIVLQDGVVPVMQFRVGSERIVDSSSLPKTLRPVARIPESAAVRVRELSLDEQVDVLDEPMIHLLNSKRWHEPVTENPILNTTEIWSLVNATEDTHPIHLHLVRFQVLDRKPFDVNHFLATREIRYVSDPFPPEPGEMGWKDTVRATPACATRIIAKFEGYPGRYVWHCHILEHEDNEMMRPYEILSR